MKVAGESPRQKPQDDAEPEIPCSRWEDDAGIQHHRDTAAEIDALDPTRATGAKRRTIQYGSIEYRHGLLEVEHQFAGIDREHVVDVERLGRRQRVGCHQVA